MPAQDDHPRLGTRVAALVHPKRIFATHVAFLLMMGTGTAGAAAAEQTDEPTLGAGLPLVDQNWGAATKLPHRERLRCLHKPATMYTQAGNAHERKTDEDDPAIRV